METNKFHLDIKQLKEIAELLRERIVKGLNEAGTEIQCLPTYIQPKSEITGKAMVLDLGGTNYRVATVDFVDGKPEINPPNTWKMDLSMMKMPGFTRKDLFEVQADPIMTLNHDEEMPIGYCFSYPTESYPGGDAKLLRWTKGVDIKEMVGELVGAPLLEYLNKENKVKFTDIKVINDTVASLFAGLTCGKYDAYIGLIVGTGCNMATFIHTDHIGKINPFYGVSGLLPVNLENGNFNPPYLTDADDSVDAVSGNKGEQRFEKAVSGMYLGEILKAAFNLEESEERFDAQKITTMLSYPDIYKDEYVKTAGQIYRRSAQLVAASIAGLLSVLKSHNTSLKSVFITAEGSLFWSTNLKGSAYKDMVTEELEWLLSEMGMDGIKIDICKINKANFIGSAIAAL
ncbi:MAG: hexokinase [Culturomica sp.]|jgi:hexokinase|nr:hexokinase [Culturomica sp.]